VTTSGPGPGPGGQDEEPILITPEMLAPARAVKPATRRDGRIDFERGMRRLPLFIVTLIVANVAVFAWETLHVANQINPLEAGALVRARVLAGEWWRVFTSMFLHGGPDHLIGNMVALYIVGMACEHAFGAARTALVYFGSGVTGAAFSLATGPGPSVGASGAIFGVLAAVAVMLYKNHDRFYVRDKRIGFVLAAWAGWQLFTGFLSPFIDNFAHLGGMTGGAIAALLLTPTLTSRDTIVRIS